MTKKFLLLNLLFLFISVAVVAQKEVDMAKYAASITAADASRHLTIIAADWMEGRETGERGQKMAAAYIADQFKGFGLKKVIKEDKEYTYYQKFDLEKRKWKSVTLSVDTAEKKFLEDFYLYGDFDMPKPQTSEVVFCGYGIEAPSYSDYKDGSGKPIQDLTGKTVILFTGEPLKDSISIITNSTNHSVWANDWRKKVTLAREKGAKNVIVIVGKTDIDFLERLENLRSHLAQPTLCFTHKERTSSAMFVPLSLAAEMLGLSDKALIEYRDERTASIIAKKNIEDKTEPKEVTLKIEVDKSPVSTENILGLIEGKDLKEEIVVVTAHYDHIGKVGDEIYYGADDDGSGTVALLELAEAFSLAYKDKVKPRRSILIMPVTAEEKGLMGSEYYTDKPVFPLSNTVANLNIDMIGRLDKEHEKDPNYVYVIGSNRLSTQLHEVNENANEKYVKLKLDYRYNSFNDPNRFYFRSDHYNFAKNNVPVIFYFNGVHEDYHKPTDTVDKINFDKLAKITQLVFYTTWELANREERIVIDVKE